MMMSRNCCFVLQAAHRVQGDLEFGGLARRRADLTRGDLHVLFANGIDHVTRREIACGELLRIEPQAHRIVAGAEGAHVAHARQAREHVAHVQHGVVAQIERVVASVRRHEVDDAHQVRRGLRRRDAEIAHFLRQARKRLRHAVLDLHLRAVHIRTDLEGDGQRERAVHRGLRRHVEHVFDTDDGLLEGRGDGFRDDLRVRSRIHRAHHDGRRDDFRILGDR